MKTNEYACTTLLAVCAIWLSPAVCSAQEKAVENGTDPSKLLSTAEAKYEYLDLGNRIGSGSLRLSFTQPLGEKQDYSLRLRVPLSHIDIPGNGSHDMGDVSLQLAHVYGLTRKHAFVLQAEAVFDTAARPELGTGKHVLKGTFIYAKFLPGGNIFAPALVQSNSVGGQDGRADVNTTTVDLYYVPKLADARNLVTLDPAVNFDWENDRKYLSLAVTAGRVLGPQLGGTGIAFVKPSLFAGGERPATWGIELGYKVIGF
jgi:hypothetical protein